MVGKPRAREWSESREDRSPDGKQVGRKIGILHAAATRENDRRGFESPIGFKLTNYPEPGSSAIKGAGCAKAEHKNQIRE
jgi:hypothetical protein